MCTDRTSLYVLVCNLGFHRGVLGRFTFNYIDICISLLHATVFSLPVDIYDISNFQFCKQCCRQQYCNLNLM